MIKSWSAFFYKLAGSIAVQIGAKNKVTPYVHLSDGVSLSIFH